MIQLCISSLQRWKDAVWKRASEIGCKLLDRMLAFAFALQFRICCLLVHIISFQRVDPRLDIPLRDENADGRVVSTALDALRDETVVEFAEPVLHRMGIGVDYDDETDVHASAFATMHANFVGIGLANVLFRCTIEEGSNRVEGAVE